MRQVRRLLFYTLCARVRILKRSFLPHAPTRSVRVLCCFSGRATMTTCAGRSPKSWIVPRAVASEHSVEALQDSELDCGLDAQNKQHLLEMETARLFSIIWIRSIYESIAMSQHSDKYMVNPLNITVFGGSKIRQLEEIIMTQRKEIADLQNTTQSLRRENSIIRNKKSILKESVGILKATIENKTEEERALKLKLSDCEEHLFHAIQNDRLLKMELTRLQGDLSILQQQLEAQTYDSHGNDHHSFPDDETGNLGS